MGTKTLVCLLALALLTPLAASAQFTTTTTVTPVSPAPAPVPVPLTIDVKAGDDGWTTTNDGNTQLRYDINPIPAGFFGFGSDAVTNPVSLFGKQIANSGGLGASTDTIVRRMAGTGPLTNGSCADVPIDFKALHLESNTFTVSYSGGATETWKIVAGLSLSAAQPIGSMTICRTCGTGGTFDADLKALFLLNYIRVSPLPAIQLQQDCGVGDCPEVLFQTKGAAWSLPSAIGGLNIDALPPNVALDVDADGVPDGVTTIGKSNFQTAIKTCDDNGGGGGGGAPECAPVDHVANDSGPKDHSRSSHSNYAAGGDSNGDGLPDHCACEDANGDGVDDDGGGHPCPQPPIWEEPYDCIECDGRGDTFDRNHRG
ncbi:MAG: hypothetical protein AAF604_03960 [Acidobacteriota bacterium]